MTAPRGNDQMAETVLDKELNKKEKELRSIEADLRLRKEELEAAEKDLRKREKKLAADELKIREMTEGRLSGKELTARDSKRKQIILRLPEALWREIADWAEYDFRSVNGQIEYLLTRSVRERGEE